MPDTKPHEMDFDALVTAIQQVHDQLAAQASKAVNISLTLRNWLIGAYISEYELCGQDRAKYGENLLSKLADRLQSLNVSSCGRRRLYFYLRFYDNYPGIVRSLNAQLQPYVPQHVARSVRKLGAASPQLAAPSKEVRSLTALSGVQPSELIEKLSYTHIEQLLGIDDDLKRAFYEIECIRGNWSVRELKRQIASLYYERSGLSKDKKKLAALVQSSVEQAEPKLAIRDPYIFEFLGIKSREVMSESDLEDALLNKLQDFLLELGHGFCFEARQKRILIGDTYGFIDLVFYHRILKCHVLIDLKIEDFSHENIGQLNTYVSWYRKNMMADGDSPPVGILLCTKKDHALVEYALAGMDNNLFVSKYQLELPRKEDIQKFLEETIKDTDENGKA